MKKRIIGFMFFISISMCCVYANEHHLYLKGESDGISIKIRLLDKYDLSPFYSVFNSSDDFLNEFLLKYQKDLSIFHHISRIATNDFPIEIKNNSGKKIILDNKYDSLYFSVGVTIKDFDSNYSCDLVSQNEKKTIIHSLYTEDEYFQGFYNSPDIGIGAMNRLNAAFTLNAWASIYDCEVYSTIRGATDPEKNWNMMIKYINDIKLRYKDFYAIYYLGMEDKEIYLYLYYE